nr:immunoglobulin light chain junction region [Macaca mulatta]
CMQALDFPCTF